MSAAAKPGVPTPKAPGELGETEARAEGKLDKYLKQPPDLNVERGKNIGRALERGSRPGFDAKAGAASDILREVTAASAPLTIPLSIAAVGPGAAALGAGVGTVASSGVEAGLRAAGAPEGTSRLGGDLAAGLVGYGTAKRAPGLKAAAGAMVPKRLSAVAQAYREAMGEKPPTPPVEFPNRGQLGKELLKTAPNKTSYGPARPERVGKAVQPNPEPEAEVTDFPNRGKVRQQLMKYTPEKTSTSAPGPKKAPAVKPSERAASLERPSTEAPEKTPAGEVAPKVTGRAPRDSDAFFKTHGQVRKAMRAAKDLYQKGVTAKDLEGLTPAQRAEALGKDHSEETFKRLLFELRGLETGKIQPD